METGSYDGISSDVRLRIIQAAEQLRKSAGDQMPNVDAVRRLARVNMNSAAVVMKEWRRDLVRAASAPAGPVPDDVQRAVTAAAEQLWRIAVEQAAVELRDARAAWQRERADNESMCVQLSAACDEHVVQLEELRRAHAAWQATVRACMLRCENAGRELATGSHALERANAHLAELRTRATVLNEQVLDLTAQRSALTAENNSLAAAGEEDRRASEEKTGRLQEDLRILALEKASGEQQLASAPAALRCAQETIEATRHTCSILEQQAANAQQIINALHTRLAGVK